MFTKITELNLRVVLESLKGHSVVFDTETTSKDPLVAQLVHIQFGSLVQDEVFWADGPFLFRVMESLIRHSVALIAHHAVYDCKVAYWGLFEPNEELLSIFCSKIYDTKIGLKLLDENADADLDSYVQEHYQDDYKAVFWSRNKNYHDAPETEQVEYACKDIVYTRLLWLYIESHPETVPTLLAHVQEFNRRLLQTSVGGLLLDRDYLLGLGVELKEFINTSETELQAEASHYTDIICMEMWCKLADKVKTPKAKASRAKPTFNWSSNGQIKDLLYNKLKLPPQKNYKTKEISVDDEALEKLGTLNPIAAKLRDYRTYTKMYTSFVEGIIEKSRKVGDAYKVHPEFNPVGTVTLRVGCSGPNYQQLPADPTWGKLRGMYIPEPGYKLITCDYQSLEVYLAAALSLDETLLKVCKLKLSFHDSTLEAMAQYGVTRAQCKTMNFAILYGGTEHRIAAITKTNLDTSKKILEAFWGKYPGIKAAIDQCHSRVDRGLPIETVYGNKRRSSGEDANRAKRQAYNFIVQSTGAGLTNRAFIEVDKALRAKGIGYSSFVLHDELIIAAKIGHESEAATITKELMEAEARKINLAVELIAIPSEPLDRWEK